MTQIMNSTVPALNLPLLEEVVAYRLAADCGSLEMDLMFDPEVHRYLKSHVFDGKPLVPGAVLHELAAEAAALLMAHRAGAGAWHFVGTDDFAIERGVAIPFGSKQVLRVLAERLPSADGDEDARVSVVIQSDALSPTGQVLRRNRRHAHATCRLARAPLAAPKSDFHLPAASRHYAVGELAIYGENFFFSHGPELRSMSGSYAVFPDQQGLVGEFELGSLEKLWLRSGNDAFVCSPLALDTAFQLHVLLVCIATKRGRLPVGSEGMRWYRRPEADERCHGIVRCIRDDDSISEARLTLVGAAGDVLLELARFRLQRHMTNPIAVFGSGAQHIDRYAV